MADNTNTDTKEELRRALFSASTWYDIDLFCKAFDIAATGAGTQAQIIALSNKDIEKEWKDRNLTAADLPHANQNNKKKKEG